MTTWDWIVVVIFVLGTSLFGLYWQKYVTSTKDWLLAGKRLRWWQIGIAETADAVDGTDYVGCAGSGYRVGFSTLGYNWYGMGFGYLILSRWIVPLLYRSGVYTNAQYLELRFNAPMRVLSTILQILYRAVAMALVMYSLATIFKIILGVPFLNGIVISLILVALYTVFAGQLGVVMATIPQVILMLITATIVAIPTFSEIGGLGALWSKIPDAARYLHIGGYSLPGVPGPIYVAGLVISLGTYGLVNQTVAQRFFAAKNEAEARVGAVFTIPLWCYITGLSTICGVAALLIVPGLSGSQTDQIYPMLLMRYFANGTGLLGLLVAGLMVASLNTAAGIGTAIGGLLTVDIYANYIRKGASDQHYLMMARVFAVVAMVVGIALTLAIPYLGGLIPFYTAITGTFFVPLAIPYVVGSLYPKASRWSGFLGVLVAVAFGLVLFFDDMGAKSLPIWLRQAQWRPIWAIVVTVIAMIIISWIENRIRGPIPESDLASQLNIRQMGNLNLSPEMKEELKRRAKEAAKLEEFIDIAEPGIPEGTKWYLHPTFWELFTFAWLIALLIIFW